MNGTAGVEAGDLLCELAVDARDSNLNEAQSRLEQARFEYKASLDLQERGLQSDVIVAQQKAAVAAAEARPLRQIDRELPLVEARGEERSCLAVERLRNE